MNLYLGNDEGLSLVLPVPVTTIEQPVEVEKTFIGPGDPGYEEALAQAQEAWEAGNWPGAKPQEGSTLVWEGPLPEIKQEWVFPWEETYPVKAKKETGGFALPIALGVILFSVFQ